MTSGYSPIGAMLASDRLIEPFLHGADTFLHGITFAGHPVSCAVALANLDVFEREGLLEHVAPTRTRSAPRSRSCSDLPIVGDVRGDGYFYGIELVKDKATKETFDDDESERLLRGFLSGALFEAGLVCRADDRGDPVIQLSPPLICEQAAVRRDRADAAHRVLTEAGSACKHPLPNRRPGPGSGGCPRRRSTTATSLTRPRRRAGRPCRDRRRTASRS